MTNLTRGNLFDSAYDATSRGMALPAFSAAEPWATLVPQLRKVVDAPFFSEIGEVSLEALRAGVAKAASAAGASSEGRFLASGAGLGAAITPTQLDPAAVLRCAALKTLRHTYLLSSRGNQKVWIVSLPKSFTTWSDRHLACSSTDLVQRLDAGDEQFDADQRGHISTAAQTGLAWTLKAQIALGDVTAGSPGLALLQRWFADATTTDAVLQAFAPTLLAGLKQIAFKLGAGSIVVTDFVPIRTSTHQNDMDMAKSNAFVGPGVQDTIYVEPPFFSRPANSVFLSDAQHWARIMVHELSHRVVRTKDYRYAWQGIRPKAGTLSGASAMDNADSWAIFVADAAGAMTAGDRQRALVGA